MEGPGERTAARREEHVGAALVGPTPPPSGPEAEERHVLGRLGLPFLARGRGRLRTCWSVSAKSWLLSAQLSRVCQCGSWRSPPICAPASLTLAHASPTRGDLRRPGAPQPSFCQRGCAAGSVLNARWRGRRVPPHRPRPNRGNNKPPRSSNFASALMINCRNQSDRQRRGSWAARFRDPAGKVLAGRWRRQGKSCSPAALPAVGPGSVPGPASPILRSSGQEPRGRTFPRRLTTPMFGDRSGRNVTSVQHSQ